MNSILVLLCVLLGQHSWSKGNAYDIKMEFKNSQGLVSGSRMLAREGHKAQMTEQLENDSSSRFIEVVATPTKIKSDEGVQMRFRIGLKNAEGVLKIKSMQTITVKENEPTQVKVGGENGLEPMTLNVTATKKEL
jgi:hypothetical protein